MKAFAVAAWVGLSICAAAQTTPAAPHVLGPVGTLSQTPPPDARLKPSVLLQKNVQARIDSLIPEAKRRGSVGLTLVDYGTYQIQLSVRAASGGAEVHAHWDDVMMVEEGNATLVTEGRVVDAKTDPNGETHGARIEGGKRQALAEGDMVTVRAGTPHQILLAPGTTYGAMVVKIREP
jgi:mannose-6-phosphate isomerase-like protein (cupin superfamily)